MMVQVVETPARGASPFLLQDDVSAWTLATRLIGLALELCGGAEYLHEAPDDVAMLELPPVQIVGRDQIADCLEESSHYLDNYSLGSQEGRLLDLSGDGSNLEKLYSISDGDASAALALLIACLRHPHRAVRTAAAASLYQLQLLPETHFHFPSLEAKRVAVALEEARWDDDPGIRELAYTASEKPPPLIAGGSGHRRRRQAGPVSLLIHGTHAYQGNWWRPRGDFYEYLVNGLKVNLCKRSSPWCWSGEVSANARRIAAEDLASYRHDLKVRRFDTILGHSYGGGVALMATRFGLKARKIVLLSAPVCDYEPNWDNVGEVISLRIHCDAVLMLDAAHRLIRLKGASVRQHFSDSHVNELPKLPFWFKEHATTHDPKVWEARSVPDVVWPKGPPPQR